MDDLMESLFSRPYKEDAHMNAQRLCQGVQKVKIPIQSSVSGQEFPPSQ